MGSKIKPTKKPKFKVGQVWKDGKGNIESIKSIDNFIRCHSSRMYTKEGRYYTSHSSAYDLTTYLGESKIMRAKGSLDYDVCLADKAYIGCQEITKKDMLRLFKAVGEWLGYEVEP